MSLNKQKIRGLNMFKQKHMIHDWSPKSLFILKFASGTCCCGGSWLISISVSTLLIDNFFSFFQIRLDYMESP